MSSLTLRLPDSLHKYLKEVAKKDGVSVNHFISTAVAEKISAVTTFDYLEERAKKADRKKFKEILSKVQDRPPLPGGELTCPTIESS